MSKPLQRSFAKYPSSTELVADSLLDRIASKGATIAVTRARIGTNGESTMKRRISCMVVKPYSKTLLVMMQQSGAQSDATRSINQLAS
jgi:hypothetical protein